MLIKRLKSLLILVSIFTICTCIDPYNPKFKQYDSLLVVDGLITDGNTSYTVKLSKTFKEQTSYPEKVSDATVFITDNSGTNISLINQGNGNYTTDSTEFTGIAGRTYVLHIISKDGAEYESEPCLMLPVPEIDSIYFAKDVEVVNNGTQSLEGLKIYVDSKDGDNNQYYRWDFEETWKFKIPYPKLFDFYNCEIIMPVHKVKDEYCWKSSKSLTEITGSVYPGQPSRVVKQPITFIATDQSDRLTLEYSILIRQYSISNNEYNFWDNLKSANQSGRDIFASQPYAVVSNIHNINNPDERVLGYFQVSAVKQKRKFISFNDIAFMQLPDYHYPCERIVALPVELTPPDACKALNQLYSAFCITSDYTFLEPVYGGYPVKLVFTTPECSNCQITGTIKKPDFWTDLN